MNAPTPDEVIADILFALKTNLLISRTGQIGSTQSITKQLLSNFGGLLRRTPPKLKQFDLATSEFVDNESPTTLSIAGFKYFARRDDPQTDPPAKPLPTSLPAVAKQFAAQSIVGFFTDWEERYRIELARAHQCDKYDFQINYFGDLGKLRHDYVHNRGICSNSAHCNKLTWFSAGDLMIPTPANYVQLLTEFPADELRRRPSRVETGRAQVSGRVDIPILREFEKVARGVHGSVGPALDEALAEWTWRHNHSSGE